MSSQQITKAQDAIVNNLSKAERIKKIMYENYEISHTLVNNLAIDSLFNSSINGQKTVQDQYGKIIKQGEFKDGTLQEWFFYKYSTTGTLLETHIYKNGKYITKVMP